MQLILRLIRRLRLSHDLPGDLLKVTCRLATRVPRHPRPIDRDHPRPHQPSLTTQRQHLPEQPRQRRLVPRHEPGDHRVIRRLHHRDRLERHVLITRPLELPRRPHPTRIPVQQQGHQHRRVIRPPADPVDPIRRIEPTQIHPHDRVQHKPSEVTLRQPIPHIRRHQKRLITITTNEILSHPQMVLNPPDDTVITRHPLAQALVRREAAQGRMRSCGPARQRALTKRRSCREPRPAQAPPPRAAPRRAPRTPPRPADRSYEGARRTERSRAPR